MTRYDATKIATLMSGTRYDVGAALAGRTGRTIPAHFALTLPAPDRLASLGTYLSEQIFPQATKGRENARKVAQHRVQVGSCAAAELSGSYLDPELGSMNLRLAVDPRPGFRTRSDRGVERRCQPLAAHQPRRSGQYAGRQGAFNLSLLGDELNRLYLSFQNIPAGSIRWQPPEPPAGIFAEQKMQISQRRRFRMSRLA